VKAVIQPDRFSKKPTDVAWISSVLPAVVDRRRHGAAGLGAVRAVAEPARGGQLGDIGVGGVDARVVEALHLIDEKRLRRHAQPVVVKQVAGEQHRMHVLVNRAVDGPLEGSAKGCAQVLAQGGRAALEGGVEVHVGQVEKSDHGRDGLRRGRRFLSNVAEPGVFLHSNHVQRTGQEEAGRLVFKRTPALQCESPC
jgi:hypothetical protein